MNSMTTLVSLRQPLSIDGLWSNSLTKSPQRLPQSRQFVLEQITTNPPFLSKFAVKVIGLRSPLPDQNFKIKTRPCPELEVGL